MRSFIERSMSESNTVCGARTRGRAIYLLGALVASLFLLPSCIRARPQTAQIPVPPEVLQSTTRFRKEYVLAAGDQLEVTVRRVPEVSRTVVIRPDGYITLPLVDDVKAEGLTNEELKQKLTELFSKRLQNPEVTVIANITRSPMVYVAGDVTQAMAIPLRNAPTTIQAIAQAGGLRRSASAGNITIIRLTQDGFVRAIPVGSKGGGQPGPYIAMRGSLLEPDDIIFVPENGRSQVTRFLQDIVNQPLQSVTAALGIYTNFRLVTILGKIY